MKKKPLKRKFKEYFTEFSPPEEKRIESFVPQLAANPEERIPENVVDLRGCRYNL